MCMVFKVWGSFTIPTAESVKNARTVIFARVAKKKKHKIQFLHSCVQMAFNYGTTVIIIKQTHTVLSLWVYIFF